MKRRQIHIALLILICCSFYRITFSQEIKKVVAAGKSTSPGNLSPEEARTDAINEAKKNALREAGIKESVSVSSVLYTSDDNIDFSQLFNEISVIESEGEIIVDSVTDKYTDYIDGNLIYEVEIFATVYKYSTKSDPEFSFSVIGINEVYFTNEKLAFGFTPSADGYLKIFNINKNTASLIYPSNLDVESKLFTKNNTFSFPLSPAYKPGYSLQIDKGKDNFEINNLIFVYTKKNIPISENINLHGILEWIYSISPSEKHVQYYCIVIKKS